MRSLATERSAQPACRLKEQVAAASVATSVSDNAAHSVSGTELDRAAAAAAAFDESDFRDAEVFRLDEEERARFALLLEERAITRDFESRAAAAATAAAETVRDVPVDLPGYVFNCSHNPDPRRQNWAAYSWDKDDPSTVTRSPYYCRSWRCPWFNGCAPHERHVMYARIEEALEDIPGDELVLIVLTLDAHLHRNLGGFELDTLYRSLRERNEWFRKRLRRQLKKMGLGDFKSAWVSVVEQHESGVPHLNVLVHAPKWSLYLKERIRQRIKSGMRGKRARYIASVNDRRDAVDMAFYRALTECGWGFASTAETVGCKQKVINYLCKVAATADDTAARVLAKIERTRAGVPDARRRRTVKRAVGEVTKNSQLPVRAPKGFRRLRSGVGFLPKRRKNEDKTGTIVRRRRTREGDEVIAPLVSSTRDDLVLMNAFIADLEQSLAWSEEDTRANELKARALMGVYGIRPKRDRLAGISKHHINPDLLRAVGLLPERPDTPEEARAGPEAMARDGDTG